MKKTRNRLGRLSAICFAGSAVGFAVAVFRQNWNEIGWGAVPRLAFISAGMVAAMAALVGAVLTDILRPRARFWVSIGLLGASLASAVFMGEK